MLLGLIVGWLMLRLLGQSTVAEARAAEAEKLRDQLGRRADVLEAANRCARALSSSLELDQAFDAFIREVRGLMPFDRIAIVLSENGVAQVMAVAGEGAEDVLPPGSGRPIHGTLLEELLRTNQTVYRRDMSCGGLSGGGRVPRARPALPARDAAAPGRAGDRDALARPHASPTPSPPRRSSSPACSAGSSRARCRTSAPTRPSARPSRSCGASRRCGPTSSRSSRTSCARRWPP